MRWALLIHCAPAGSRKIIKNLNDRRSAIDGAAVLTKILSNGECGCRGEDGNQSRLNASANLERPVQTGLSVFWNNDN